VHARIRVADCHGAGGIAVIPALECHEPVLAAYAAVDPILRRHLHCDFDGDRTGVRKVHASEIVRQQLRKTPCQHKCLLVNQATKHDVRHRRELRFHGLSDVRMIVAVAGRPPAGDAVDQFTPVGQSDARAMRAHNR
jgi:hypothetical protein